MEELADRRFDRRSIEGFDLPCLCATVKPVHCWEVNSHAVVECLIAGPAPRIQQQCINSADVTENVGADV